MIKIVLVIYAITAQGYASETVGQFKNTNMQYCRDVGTQLVQRLEQRKDIKKATFRCIEITDV